MGLLRKKADDPVTATEAELASLRARRDKLIEKAASAADELKRAVNQRRRTLLEIDLDNANDPRIAVGHLRDKADAIGDAIIEVDGRIVEVGQRLADVRDAAGRQGASGELGVLIDALAAAADRFATASADMLQALGPATFGTPHSSPTFASTVEVLTRDVTTAVRQLMGHARRHAKNIVVANAEIHRPSVPHPPTPPPMEIEQREIFALVRLRWTEDGQTKCCDKFAFAHLPVAAAERAIARNLADVRESERTKKLIAAFGISTAVIRPQMGIDVVNLDAEPVTDVGAPKYFDAF